MKVKVVNQNYVFFFNLPLMLSLSHHVVYDWEANFHGLQIGWSTATLSFSGILSRPLASRSQASFPV
jgi:hypothetical protein